MIAMTPQDKKKVIFFGDSITELGTSKNGYISRMQQELDTIGYKLTGSGIGGNKVYDLYLRLEEDVLNQNPDIVFIYIGINDINHKKMGYGMDIGKFEKFYVALIKKIQGIGCKVIVCTPSVIGEKKDRGNPQDADLDAFSNVIRRLATTHHCSLVDLREAFTAYLRQNNSGNKVSGILTADKVHLNAAGNKLVATEMLKMLLNN